MTVNFIPRDEAITESQLNKLEKQQNIQLPKTYKAFLLKFNAAKPEENIIEVDNFTAGVKGFYGISESKIYDLQAKIDTFYSRMPLGVLPIADDASGNQFCLQPSTGRVFFWDHENEAGEDENGIEEEPSFDNMTLLANSFDEFLVIMHPYTQERFEQETKDLINHEENGTVTLSDDFNEIFKDYLIKK